MRSERKIDSSMSWVMNSTEMRNCCQMLVRISCITTRVWVSSAPNGSAFKSPFGRGAQHEHLRAGGRRAHDADALLHAAGELVGIVVLEAGQSGEVEQRTRRNAAF